MLVRKIYSHGGRYCLATEFLRHTFHSIFFHVGYTHEKYGFNMKTGMLLSFNFCKTSLGISGKAMEKFVRQKKKNQLNLVTNDNHSLNNMEEFC